MNNRKAKKIKKANELFTHYVDYSFRELMQSYYWWLKYMRKRKNVLFSTPGNQHNYWKF